MAMQNIYKSVSLPSLENSANLVMLSKTGIHLLKESGGRCLHNLNGFVLNFLAFLQLLSKSDLPIFMYETNFKTELGNTIEV